LAVSNESDVVHLYRRVGAEWRAELDLLPPPASPAGGFGTALALESDRLFVGDPNSVASDGTVSGEIVEFRRVAEAWTMTARLLPSAPHADQQFGQALALSAATLATGGLLPDPGIEPSVHVLGPSGGFDGYGAGQGAANVIALTGGGSTQLGGTFEASSAGVPADSVVTLVAFGPDHAQDFGGRVWIDLARVLLALPAPADAGTATVAIALPAEPAFLGYSVFLQSYALSASPGAGLALSNGLQLTLCP
jgi:hypothetical protein